YEKLRAYRVLNRVMGEDETRTATNDIQKALSYSFSTRAQFMMVLEAQGYALTLKDGWYGISKYGRELTGLDVAKVDKQISTRQKDKGRIAQPRAIIKGYSHGHDPVPYPTDSGYTSALADFLREKFGLHVIFH